MSGAEFADLVHEMMYVLKDEFYVGEIDDGDGDSCETPDDCRHEGDIVDDEASLIREQIELDIVRPLNVNDGQGNEENNVDISRESNDFCENSCENNDHNCNTICGRILRLMGDEENCRVLGRHLRNIGDDVFYRQTAKYMFDLLEDLMEHDNLETET